VFDLDGIQLLETARALSKGRYLSGRPIEPAPHLFLGAAENPGAPPYEHRVERAQKKVRAGARFFQLQVSFEVERLEAFMAEAVRSGLAREAALLPSICLVRSPSALRYMDANVPGISVPAEMIERTERAADPEEACFELSVEIAERTLALPGVAGLHLISFRREAGIARLCQRLGIPPRDEREASGNRPEVAV
jgi:methylenetetrahydrofolate reductase (NADPH)